MSTIIRTRSPYFIRTPQETNSLLNYFQVVITVHGGQSGSIEICDNLYSTYTLKKKPLPNEDSVTFDISELVNDHIVQTYDGNPTNSKATQSIWVNVVTSARQSDGSIIGTATTTNYLAQEGYNLFKERVNYTTEPNAMLSANYLQYEQGGNIRIPVNVERVSSVQWRNNSTTLETDNFSDNGNQNQKIQYAQYKQPDLVNNCLVTHTGGTTTITLESVEECKFGVNKITFLNRWGALQDLYFFKKSVETLDSRSENFNSSIFKARTVTKTLEEGEGEGEAATCVDTITYNQYSTTAHAKKTFNANATESVTLNTGFVNELMNPYFEELMVSEYIWLTDSSNVIYPVNLKDSSFTYKTSLNDKLINYTMNFEKSFDLVNNIR